MWRYLMAVILLAVFTDYGQTQFDQKVEKYGPPTVSDYLTELGYVSPDTFEVTAYLAVDKYERRFHGITFSGVPAKPYHTVAVDPKVVPLGSWIYIDGLGWWKAIRNLN